MIDSNWPVPRSADIPFHVCIKRKHLAVVIEVQIDLVAKTARNDLFSFSLTIHSQYKANSIVLSQVACLRGQPVVLRISIRRRGERPVGKCNIVSNHDIDHAVGPQSHLIGTMSVSTSIIKLDQFCPELKNVVLIFVLQPNQFFAVG